MSSVTAVTPCPHSSHCHHLAISISTTSNCPSKSCITLWILIICAPWLVHHAAICIKLHICINADIFCYEVYCIHSVGIGRIMLLWSLKPSNWSYCYNYYLEGDIHCWKKWKWSPIMLGAILCDRSNRSRMILHGGVCGFSRISAFKTISTWT